MPLDLRPTFASLQITPPLAQLVHRKGSFVFQKFKTEVTSVTEILFYRISCLTRLWSVVAGVLWLIYKCLHAVVVQ